MEFYKIVSFLSAARKIDKKMRFFGLAGVLVGFSKKRSKKTFFIGGFCAFGDLSISI